MFSLKVCYKQKHNCVITLRLIIIIFFYYMTDRSSRGEFPLKNRNAFLVNNNGMEHYISPQPVM